MAFSVTVDAALAVDEAWRRVTRWDRHGSHVPFTRTWLEPPGPTRVGSTLVARTGIGRLAFDDCMEIEQWQPPRADQPGRARLVRRRGPLLGSAEIVVTAYGSGTAVTWAEDVVVRRIPVPISRAANRLGVDRLGAAMFGRVLRRLLAES